MLRKLSIYLATHTKEQIQKSWDESREATKDILSPTIGEFLNNLENEKI